MIEECSVDDCSKSHYARGWCQMHYRRFKRHGSTDDPHRCTEDRLRRRAPARRTDECWPWAGAVNDKGYGQLYVGNRREYVHRIAYEVAHGPIPEGVVVAHECHNRDPKCVAVASARIEGVRIQRISEPCRTRPTLRPASRRALAPLGKTDATAAMSSRPRTPMSRRMVGGNAGRVIAHGHDQASGMLDAVHLLR